MTGHLGTRVSALLDGQLTAVETERAWAHVHLCHACRDAVEREGWVKTRLAGMTLGPSAPSSAPAGLKAGLLDLPPGDLALAGSRPGAMGGSTGGVLSGGFAVPATMSRTRRTVGIAALGGGAVGAAVMGVLALGAAPADAPGADRRAPVTQIQSPVPGRAELPTRPEE